jgi:transposase
LTNVWPNLSAHCRTFSWLTMMPRAASNLLDHAQAQREAELHQTAWLMISAGNRWPA